MQATSELYKSILSMPHDVETKLEVYTKDGETFVGSYGEGALVSVNTGGKLFSTPTIGGVASRQIDLKMLIPNEIIPRMAMLKPFARLKCGEEISEWVKKGVFFIDTRNVDEQMGVLTIHGYDAMLKTEQPYAPDASGTWPRAMTTIVNDICARIGVKLDGRTVINPSYYCQLDTTLTMRQYLSYIAIAHGGNWIITDAGELRLIGLADIPPEINYLITENGETILFGDIRLLV